MAEQIFVVVARSRPVYEVVKSEDGSTLTIRSTSKLGHAISMPSEAVPSLIDALNAFTTTPQPGPETN
jgi:hypothetical protein